MNHTFYVDLLFLINSETYHKYNWPVRPEFEIVLISLEFQSTSYRVSFTIRNYYKSVALKVASLDACINQSCHITGKSQENLANVHTDNYTLNIFVIKT